VSFLLACASILGVTRRK